MKELTEQQLKHYRQSLQALQAELQALLEKLSADAEAIRLDQSKLGRLSRVDAIQQNEMAKANRTSYLQRLARVAKALAALDDGEYGYCEVCGQLIDPRRLEIRPESLRCVSCQSASE